MIPFDDPLWIELQHAYGSAVDIPELLERIIKDPSQENWNTLWDHLCPDDELFSASFATLPHLVTLAASLEPGQRFDFLLLVGSILIHGEGHKLADVLRHPIEAVKEELIRTTIETLEARPLVEEQALYLLCTLCAALGHMDLARALPKLSTEDLQLYCPRCHAHLALWYTKEGLGIFEIDAEEASEGVALVGEGKLPWQIIRDSETMTQESGAEWLCPLAMQAGFLDLAKRIHQFFGKVSCPACDDSYTVASRILG